MYLKQRHDTSSKIKYQRFVALTSGTTARLWTGWTAPPLPWLKEHWLQKKVLKRLFTTSEQFTFCKVKISICYNLTFGFMNKHDSYLVPHAFAKEKKAILQKSSFHNHLCWLFWLQNPVQERPWRKLWNICKRNKVYKSQKILKILWGGPITEWPTC